MCCGFVFVNIFTNVMHGEPICVEIVCNVSYCWLSIVLQVLKSIIFVIRVDALRLSIIKTKQAKLRKSIEKV